MPAWSRYQTDIFDFVTKGSGNGAGIAVAGSGKTTTAVESMKLLDLMTEGFFATFSKAIADELGKRIGGMGNVGAGTYNSFGYRLCRDAMTIRPQHDEDKTERILRYNVLNNLMDDTDRGRFYKWRNTIIRLISLFKGQLLTTPDMAAAEYGEICDRFDIETPTESWFPDVLFDTYRACLADTTHFDFDDQKLMPILLDLPFPNFDFLIIDEFQDTNKLESELMLRTSKKGRTLVIGDPDQSIYSFRGATPDSMAKFITDMKAQLLPLYICYRCSKAVVEEAQKIVPHIEAATDAVGGCVDRIKKEDAERNAQAGDFVLCRTTAPAVAFCLARIREGKHAFVKGKEIGTGLLGLINAVTTNDGLDAEEFSHELKAWATAKLSDLQRFNRKRQIEALEDKLDTVDALILDCGTVKDLKNKVLSVFKESGRGINCMTIHKSKGLEVESKNETVYLLREDLIPHPKSNDPAEEIRLKYVAVTRAKGNFFYVMKGKDDR